MWLYLPPSASSPSAPASEGSTSGSSSPSETGAELWVTSSGKPTLRPYSWRGWATRPWMKLLSGTTLPPSTADRGAERWISSLRGSPASPGATLERGEEPMTNGGSGPSSRRFYARWSRATSSWRMFQASLVEEGSARYLGDWPRSGSMRSGRCSEQRTLELPTEEIGSSSWPTAIYGAHPGMADRNHLTGQAQWATPTSRDHKDGPMQTETPTNHLLGRQAPRSATGGQTSSPSTPNSPRRLNPLFVELLMGLPLGWTDFAPLGTGWSLPKPPSRSEYYGGVSYD